MITDEQAIALVNIDDLTFENIFTLDGRLNRLSFPAIELSIALNEAQKRLMICLLKNINCKREIIKVVWNDNHQRIRDNNYHQLVFQFRALLQRNGLPANLIVTIPYYGLKLNVPLLRNLLSCEILAENTTSEAEPRKLLPQLISFARSLF
jgi:DNA-binding winged helix-turn-helix (wHTH) protein